ncbi:hypothetical protein BH792_gp108 [Staphylococcus phage Stau2]|uniref:Uncharacterized protein n=1 Tax=Staphylococcus phage Stau2 TaxID=1200862 RepID=A0A0U1ZVJ5_9CAUD|nr:hypothetical protein BH792_gp108 [Staphylococcus phage Stau2]AKA61358.1 hypothetical protein Stau2_107 [Staphylococcus phage Stau2]
MRKERIVDYLYNVKSIDNNLTIQGIENSLFNKESLQDLVPDFDTSSREINESNLYLCTIPEDYNSDHVESGQYIGIDVGYVSEDPAFDHLIGQVPRSVYEKAHVMQPLIKIENTDIDYTQADMINDIKVGTSISDVKIKNKLSLVSNNLITHLEIVDKYYFDSSIEETLLKYYELKNPDYYLKHFLKLKELVGDNRMIYCPLLLKCIKVID